MNDRLSFRLEGKDRINVTIIGETLKELSKAPAWRGVSQTDVIKTALEVAAEAIKQGTFSGLKAGAKASV